MASMIQKLGAGILAATIPFGVAGCVRKENVKEETQVHTVNHFSEIFSFKRDELSGKVFIGRSREDLWSQAIKERAFSHHDMNILADWEFLFNRRADKQEQVEINLNTLPAPLKGVEQNVVFPQDKFVYHPFAEVSGKGPAKDFTYLAIPYSTYMQEYKLPLAMTIKDDFEFQPESLSLKYYVDEIWYSQGNHSYQGNIVKTGLAFKIRTKKEDNKTTLTFDNVIVSLNNLPLTIDTGKKMYLIGLDKVKVEKGEVSRVISVR